MADKFKCGQCGAELEYGAGTTALKCPYCGAANTIAATGPVSAKLQKEIDLEAYLRDLESQTVSAGVEVKTVKCSTCGGETTLQPHVTSGFCDFCGAQLQAPAETRKVLAPQYLLPFKLTREESKQQLEKWLKGLWFAPVGFKRLAYASGQVKGIYFPFWTFDARTATFYTGARGDDQRVADGTDEKGNTKYKTVTHWSPRSGNISKNFDDILIPGSTSLPAGLTNRLDDWNLDALVEYREEFIAGFHAESYTVEVRAALDQGKTRMEFEIEGAIKREIGGDHQRIDSRDTRYGDVTFKYVLLPIWFTIYNYQGKLYNVVINASSGEVEGERPWSVLKIALLVIVILLLIIVGYGMTR